MYQHKFKIYLTRINSQTIAHETIAGIITLFAFQTVAIATWLQGYVLLTKTLDYTEFKLT